ncbi:MAG: hypothetical protein BWY10_02344 [Chloroflexi bacterium ADurb.Bin180]|nr:MAG: hypothetical protein BWY10_02344 [Chloroflexi bacterium ADurb.Bin180]
MRSLQSRTSLWHFHWLKPCQFGPDRVESALQTAWTPMDDTLYQTMRAHLETGHAQVGDTREVLTMPAVPAL